VAFDPGKGSHCPAQTLGPRPQWIGRENGLGNKAFKGGHQTSHSSQIFGATPALVFLGAPMLGGVGEQRRTNEERAGTFGSVEFVGANRNQIRFELVDALEGQFSEGLDCVGVKGDTLFTA
jgi:hypothetical protein